MKNKLIIFLLAISVNCVAQKNDLYIEKFTGVNPVSYTDVIYIGMKDTVLVSKYNGEINKVINGSAKEINVAKINDEIYVLSYNKSKKQIAASTLENGIVIINELSGKIHKKLPLIQTWSLKMDYSDDLKYLFANDQRGNRFIWNVESDYKPISLPKEFPSGTILSIRKNIVTLITPKKLVKWDLLNQKSSEEINIEASLTRLADIDSSNNILNINYNTAEFINLSSRGIIFSVKHPSYLRPVESKGGDYVGRTARSEGIEVKNGYFEDTNYQMPITTAKFANNKIYTASIDRSLRVWDKYTGKLINNLTGHKGSISKIKVTSDEKQVVSVDLLGVIKFWNVEI